MFLAITKDRAKTDDQELTSYLLVCNVPLPAFLALPVALSPPANSQSRN